MSQYLGFSPYYLNYQAKSPPSHSIDSGNSSGSSSNSGNSSCDEIDVESVGDDSTLNKSSFSIDNLLKRNTKQPAAQPLVLPNFYNHQPMLWNPILLQSALTAVNNQTFVRITSDLTVLQFSFLLRKLKPSFRYNHHRPQSKRRK